MTESYCVKCKANRAVKQATTTTLKNGRPVMRAVCGTCGTKTIRFLKKS